MFDNSGFTHAVCPGGRHCEGANTTPSTTAPALSPGTTQLITRVRCYASSCTNTGDSADSPERGKLFIHSSSLTISDSSRARGPHRRRQRGLRRLEARHARP